MRWPISDTIDLGIAYMGMRVGNAHSLYDICPGSSLIPRRSPCASSDSIRLPVPDRIATIRICNRSIKSGARSCRNQEARGIWPVVSSLLRVPLVRFSKRATENVEIFRGDAGRAFGSEFLFMHNHSCRESVRLGLNQGIPTPVRASDPSS